jgi:hypothetical protein
MPDEPVTETGEPKPLWPEFPEDTAPATPEHDAPQTLISFPRAISGQWIFDPDRSEMPGLDDIDIEKDIIVKIETDGEWLAAAPLISARIPNNLIPDLSIALRLAVRGRLEITHGPDAQGRFTAKTSPAQILEQQYAIGGDNKAADMTEAVAPYLRMALADLSKGGQMSLSTDHDDRLLTLEGQAGSQVFRRPSLNAKLNSLRFVNDHKAVHTPTGFDTPEGVAKGTNFADPGVALAEPHWTPSYNAGASFTQGETIVAEADVTVAPKGTRFRLIGRCPGGLPLLDFDSAITVATGSPQRVLVQARAKLPPHIFQATRPIAWHLQSVEPDAAWANLRSSGPHFIFGLLGKPLPGPSGKANHPTPIRLSYIVEAVSGAATPVDLNKHTHPGIYISKALDPEHLSRFLAKRLVGYPGQWGTFPRARQDEVSETEHADPAKIAAMSGDELWALLDLEVIPEGLVAEAGELFNLMRAMIGMTGLDGIVLFATP